MVTISLRRFNTAAWIGKVGWVKPGLSVNLKYLKFDIIQTVTVKWILKLVLNVIQGNQNKLSKQNDKIDKEQGGRSTYGIQNCWGIDQREKIDKKILQYAFKLMGVLCVLIA